MAIRVKEVVYSPADIYAMFATPQVVLPAPAAGYVNNILSVSHSMEFVTLAYVGTDEFNYGVYSDGTISTFYEEVSLPAIIDTNIPLLQSQGSAGVFSTKEDFSVWTHAAASVGNSPITALIIYEVKLLDT